jgi:TctA family transporter
MIHSFVTNGGVVMDAYKSGRGWTERDERIICLLVASISGGVGLFAFGGGDPLADTTAVIAGLLAVVAGIMAAMAGSSGSMKGE